MGPIKNPEQTDMLEDNQTAENRQWSVMAFQHIVDGVLFLHAETGIILAANRAACQLTGYTTDELIGKHYSLLFTKTDSNTTTGKLLEQIQVVDNNFISVEIDRTDGSSFKSDISASVVVTPDNDKAILIILRDATESDILRRNLSDTLHALKRRGVELEIFTRTISHDLQSPLVTVDSFLQIMEMMIRKQQLPSLEDINNTRQAVNRMSELLRGLLELARSGKRIGERQPCKINNITTQACKMLLGKIQHYQAQIHIADDLPVVWGDNLRLLQVMLNLIDNALKFHQPGTTPAIRITPEATPHGKAFCVQDNGIGVNPSDQKRIFDNFARLENSVEGSGMGLATVYSIIEQHGGKVWVESQGHDSGSTFYIILPEVQL